MGAASVDAIVQRLFGQEDGVLHIGGVAVPEIVREFGAPLYVFDAGILRAKLAALRAAFPDFDVHYSVKANPSPSVVDLFLREGAGLEIASGGELHLALRLGCPAERILFAGPGKTDVELRAAIEAGVAGIHAESLREVQRMAAIAEELGAEVPVALRVNPAEEIQGGAMVMGGKPTAFGIDEEQIDGAVEFVRNSPHLRLSGLHLYAGTQILDHDVLRAMYAHYLDLAESLCRRFQLELGVLDVGGGFGVPYFGHDEELDMDALAAVVREVMHGARGRTGLANTRFVIEPGRYLTAEAGVYLARVLDVKTSRGQHFVVLDGGMHHLLAATGHVGQVIKRNYPIALVSKLGHEAVEKYTLAGSLCTPLDTVGRNLALPQVEPGDVVVFFQSGAYGRTFSPVRFLSHREPAEVLVDGGSASLIREHGSDADVLDGTPYANG